uniref:Polycystic kidney disease protein 1-like 3-like n=1 Tax=Saccoglossus kowalevskii TaxID=10224 RepID=A0ABM0GNB4_SACKO
EANFNDNNNGQLIQNEDDQNTINEMQEVRSTLIDIMYDLTADGSLLEMPSGREQTAASVNSVTSFKNPSELTADTQEKANVIMASVALKIFLGSSNIIVAANYQEKKVNLTENSDEKSMTVITTALDVIDTALTAALVKVLPDVEPVVLETQQIKVELSKEYPDELSGKRFVSAVGGFTLPDSNEHYDYLLRRPVGTKFMSFRRNPYSFNKAKHFADVPVVDLVMKLGTQDLDTTVYRVYIGYKYLPSEKTYDKKYVAGGSYPYEIMIPTQKRGIYNVLVKLDVNDKINDIHVNGTTLYQINSTRNETNESTTIDILPANSEDGGALTQNGTLSVRLHMCRYWNTHNKQWEDDGCMVASSSDDGFIRCQCNHLTSFTASDFVVPVNKIDFGTVFTKNILDNSSVLITILTFFVAYVLLAIYLRRKDKQDIVNWRLIPLSDNEANCTYNYQITVYTGIHSCAGTKSNVQFILSSDTNDTGIRSLAGTGRNVSLGRGSVTNFVMAVPEYLGQLQYIRLWHDHSGYGDAASWYLERIVVFDLQTEERFDFTCYKWFAVDKGDGKVERILPADGSMQLSSLKNIFSNTTRDKLSDDYLWGSMFWRPTRSTFTRLQRLSCCAAFIYLTMIANAMFYDTSGGDGGTIIAGTKTIVIGPFRLSLGTLYISFISCLVTVPMLAIIMKLFQKSSPRRTRTSQRYKVVGSRHTESTNLWPWWVVIIAWGLVVIAMVVPSFFVILYSLQWGKETSEEWMTSQLTSLILSALVIDPLKAFGISLLISVIYARLQKPYIDEHILQASSESESVSAPINVSKDSGLPNKRPLTETEVKSGKEVLMKEKRVISLLRDLVFYLIFLSLVSAIASVYRNDALYYAGKNVNDILSYNTEVTNADSFWKWIRNDVVRGVFPWKNYNGNILPTDNNDMNVFGNLVSYSVGPVVLRQLRVNEGVCETHSVVSGITKCYGEYSSVNEDIAAYNTSWTPFTDLTNVTSQSPWIHSSVLGLPINGVPFVSSGGTAYNDGGYIATLGRSEPEANELCSSLYGLYFLRLNLKNMALEEIQKRQGTFGTTRYLVMIDEIFTIFLACISFMTIISYVRILAFNFRIRVLQETLAIAWPQIKSFSIMFFLVFFAFAHMLYILLCRMSVGFMTLWTTVFNLLTIVVNSNLKEDLSHLSNSTFIQVILITFVIVEVWVVLMVLLAIVDHSCTLARSKKYSENLESDLIAFLSKKMRHLMSYIPCHKQVVTTHAHSDEGRIEHALTESDVNICELEERCNRIDVLLQHLEADVLLFDRITDEAANKIQ